MRIPYTATVLGVLIAVGCSKNEHGPSKSGNLREVATGRLANAKDAAIRLTPYLLFDGDCKEAMEFYQSVFGGELSLTTVGDSPMKDAFPVQLHGRVVSAKLRSPLAEISASDWLRPAEKRLNGNTVCLYLSGGSPEETMAAFGKLSEVADVTDPIGDQPFGLYGALNDRFGIRWMVHAENN